MILMGEHHADGAFQELPAPGRIVRRSPADTMAFHVAFANDQNAPRIA